MKISAIITKPFFAAAEYFVNSVLFTASMIAGSKLQVQSIRVK